MKNLRLKTKVARTLRGRSRGVTLIEVLIALALFSIIAITFISGLAVAARAVFIGDQRTTAESLARTQLEFVKSQATYDPAEWEYYVDYERSDGEKQKLPTWWDENPASPLGDEYHAYTVSVVAQTLYEDPDNETDPLDGLQKVIVTVRHDDRVVFTLEGYNRDRN